MRTSSLRFVASLGSLSHPHWTRTLSLNQRFVFCTQLRFTYCSSTREMPPSKTVVEYAKSGRSACKKCANVINKDAVRVGAVVKDPRGFDATKWHHMHCFPFYSSQSKENSLEAISGFSSLKSIDQEAMKKLIGRPEKISEEGSDGSNMQVNLGEPQVSKIDNNEETNHEKDPKKRKISPSREEDKVNLSFSVSDIKDKYKDAKLPQNWKAFQTLIFLERDEGLGDSSKIAAFDFDGCLVNTSVRRVGADAWSLLYPSIPEKLQTLYNDGYKLVIFTNEANIERWKNKRQVAVDSKLGRLNSFLQLVKVPMQVFIACGIAQSSNGTEDPFRKPKPGMWHVLANHFNSGIPVNMDRSFYVGDAGGRVSDHSDADIKFAEAIGLKFYVPEEYFQT